MNLKKQIFTENACYKKGEKITPKGIMLHSTGANNPNLSRYIAPDDGLIGVNKYNNHWNQPMSRSVCVHAFIGKLANGNIACYQTLPWDMRAWHCGGTGNDTHVSIEICEDDLKSADYFNRVYNEAVDVCAHLCKEFNLDPAKHGVLIDHKEGNGLGIASSHGDVEHWFKLFGKTMDDFRADVNKKLDNPFPFDDVPKNTWYREAVEWAWREGIANGKSEKKFDPNANMTRAEVVTMLYRIFNK